MHGTSLDIFEEKKKGMHTKQVGDISEVHVLAAFVAAGISVSIPWGENQRYDLVAEAADGRLLKVQCKTAQLIDDGAKLNIPLKSVNYWKDDESAVRTYEGQVDLIAAWSPDTKKIYLISPEAGTAVYLRLKPTKNNIKKNVRWASEYEFDGTLP